VLARKVTVERGQFVGRRAASVEQFPALSTLPHSVYSAVLMVCSDVPDAQNVDPDIPDIL